MTKADIIDCVCESVGGLSKKEATTIVQMVFDLLRDALTENGKVKISGFGNFVIRTKKARPGRNPQTGEEITIASRKVLTFKPSNVLKTSLNTRRSRHS